MKKLKKAKKRKKAKKAKRIKRVKKARAKKRLKKAKKRAALKKRIKKVKKARKAKKTRKAEIPLKEEKRADLVGELVARGKQRGFITEDEIIHIMPEIESDLEQLESLYEKLELSGVRVVSSDEMLKLETEQAAKEYEKKKAKPSELAVPEEELDRSSSDLVQMYLKEIGRISLLNGRGGDKAGQSQ